MDCTISNPDLIWLMSMWVYGISAISGAVGLYAAIVLISRREIRRIMRGYVISGTVTRRGKNGWFVARGQ